MKKIIIYGTSEFSKLISFYLKDKYEIACYTVEKKYLANEVFQNKPVVAFENIEKHYNPNEYDFFVAIGYSFINKLRERIAEQVEAKGYDLISYTHPTSKISNDVEIKKNTFIFENVVIQPFVKLEENIIIWSNATVCHDSIIEKNCFIGANACINGFSKIGKNSFIGANSTIRNDISIGNYNIVGAGCTILKDTKDKTVYRSQAIQLLDIQPIDVTI